jgi:hypothetical protein
MESDGPNPIRKPTLYPLSYGGAGAEGIELPGVSPFDTVLDGAAKPWWGLYWGLSQ